MTRLAIRLTACLFALLMPVLAFAGDATDPVRAVMDKVVHNWRDARNPDGQSVYRDYFDEATLSTTFSAGFIAAYRAAQAFPAYEEGTSPFDYDVMTDSQDGCPLEDVAIGAPVTEAGVSRVTVRYKFWRCGGGDEAERVSTLVFEVIEESGRPVINDVIREREGSGSLLQEMRDIPEARKG